MIEYIKGELTELTPALATVEAAGVGYGLNISLTTYSAIQGKQQVKLYVYEAIREDAYMLYGFVSKKQPIFEKSERKNCLYAIDDNFYRFWFGFIFKYNYILEIENYAKLQEIMERDYDTFSGLMLERYFHSKAMETGKYTRIGRWWDHKGENEIDMITADELSESVTFFEIKRNQEEISIGILKKKAEALMRATYQFKDFKVFYEGLSLQQM